MHVFKFTIHDALLSTANIMELYSGECGQHLHGYYVEYDKLPVRVRVQLLGHL